LPSLISNDRAVGAVSRALAGGSPPHAWLFVGPERLGKARLARWLAQALNCERVGVAPAGAQHALGASVELPADGFTRSTGVPKAAGAAPLQDAPDRGDPFVPCGECAACRRIAAGIHADVQTVTVEQAPPEEPQRKAISVEQLREVQQSAALNPFEGRTRVVIIDPADAMLPPAQNAFLKTLEEPPPNVVFVLIATQDQRLLPTVHSRCRRIEFSLVAAAAIEEALVERGVEPERAHLLARLAGGRAEWALEMAADPANLEARREVLEQAHELGAMAMADRMELAERLADQFRKDRDAVLDRLDGWLGWWRDVMLVSASGGAAADGVANVDMLEMIRDDAERCEPAEVVRFVEALRECRQQLEQNVQARLALDALMVQAPRATTASRRV